MGGMTDTPEAPERVALHYTGTTSLSLSPWAHPVPEVVHPGGVVTVDRAAADILLAANTEWGGHVWSEVAGAALDAALKDAGLSTSGTADEKRARLAEHNATVTPTTDQEADRG